MDDGDEFDDDLADEDFLTAFDQPSAARTAPSIRNSISVAAKTPQRPFIPQAAPSTAVLELQDLPSDAFSSPEPPERNAAAKSPYPSRPTAPRAFTRSESSTLRQTTLWGTQAASQGTVASQRSTGPASANTQRVFRADLPREEPSHHELDHDAIKTWTYPTNLGAIRDYQFSIFKNSLFNNTLVALPTGLGKTFIAATVMLNFYRWTKSAKLVFVAPTKPLVAQQIDACYNIVGIPRSQTTLLTGDVAPALRVDEWATKRVFFMTPQTLLNDLSHGYADPKSIVLLVIDEAHRAVGEYAYAKVTKFIRRFSKSFRVLALTATPGSKVETVQEVIDNLGISHCEIRTEDSIDIRQYVHQRNIDPVVLDPSDEMNLIYELFTDALKPLVEKLASQNIYYGRNPMALTAYGLMQAQKEWFATRGQHTNQGVQFMMRAIFSVLTGLAHSIKLLNFHGIKPFYDNMVDFRTEQEDRGEKGSKYKRQLIEHESFQKMMKTVSTWLKKDGFVGHPKLTALADVVLNHFMDKGQGSATRVIVFSKYRDSAEDIVRMFNKHRPLVKASVFVGQADGKRGEGMKQTQQIRTIERFKEGDFNVLVATSIGEEGLDIGQVDLIVCYDASASPIRMLQRMGRTGRKRAGNITLLLMRGKEEDQFARSKDNYEKMQSLICEGSRFNFRFDLSTRIVPREARPEVDKRHVDIPVENSQDQSLPEPRKRRAPPGKKKPPKKFHMPEGVETGFQPVSSMLKGAHRAGAGAGAVPAPRNAELDDLVEVPALSEVLLNREDLEELNRSYRDLPFNHSAVEETDMPSMTSYPELQRRLQPVVKVKHGNHTLRCVRALGKMGRDPEALVRSCRDVDDSRYREIPVKPFVRSDGEEEMSDNIAGPQITTEKKAGSGRKRPAAAISRSVSHKGQYASHRGTASRARATSDSGHEGSEAEEEGLPKRRKSGRGRGGKKAVGGRRGKRTGGINSDELGDDCVCDSDVMEESDSDSGADLLDFVVGDNQATSSMVDSQATSSTSVTEQATPRGGLADKPFFVPSEFPATQGSEDMPDVATLLGPRQASGQERMRDELEDAEPTGGPTVRPARARRRLLDSDSDDEE